MPNDIRTYIELKTLGKSINYFPNYYEIDANLRSDRIYHIISNDKILNIGCFGAIRGLKNHLRAAGLALKYATDNGLTLKFHINSERLEGGFVAQNTLKNLRALLGDSLIEHSWLTHSDFITLCQGMDAVIVTSLSETFNIVAADAISAGIPVIGSDEIPWLSEIFQYAPTNSFLIYTAMMKVLKNPIESWKIEYQALNKWNSATLKFYKNYSKHYFNK
ncbi:MAG: glycosyltransferase [Candidatus Omnitrophica bacterium]|nr:glycosyltransferase [Candidatus Omnitrophota bacterium]